MIDNKIIKSEIIQAIESLIDESPVELNESTALLGDSGLMDSMSLVELCLILEDKASELGFEFDWTSDSAMSRSRSMFRSVGSLTDEMIRQMEEQQ